MNNPKKIAKGMNPAATTPWTGRLGRPFKEIKNVTSHSGHRTQELRLWNWVKGAYSSELNCDFEHGTNEISTAFKSLGLSVKPGDNICHTIEHRDDYLPDKAPDTYTVAGQTYLVSAISYEKTAFEIASTYTCIRTVCRESSWRRYVPRSITHSATQSTTNEVCSSAIFAQNLESPKMQRTILGAELRE